MKLTFEPTPTLTINDEVYYGINIIDKLHSIMNESDEAKKMFIDAVSIYQRNQLPKIGFCVEDNRAVVPTKRVIDVGYDLTVVSIYSQPTQLTTMFETYISLDIPLGYYVELVPRSSLSKTGYMLANSVGIIDPGFTGTLKVPLIKVDQSAPNIQLPARVAQLILKPYVVSESYLTNKTELVKTIRGSQGFGSTG